MQGFLSTPPLPPLPRARESHSSFVTRSCCLKPIRRKMDLKHNSSNETPPPLVAHRQGVVDSSTPRCGFSCSPSCRAELVPLQYIPNLWLAERAKGRLLSFSLSSFTQKGWFGVWSPVIWWFRRGLNPCGQQDEHAKAPKHEQHRGRTRTCKRREHERSSLCKMPPTMCQCPLAAGLPAYLLTS